MYIHKSKHQLDHIAERSARGLASAKHNASE